MRTRREFVVLLGGAAVMRRSSAQEKRNRGQRHDRPATVPLQSVLLRHRSCQTPMLVLPDDVTAHPLQVSIDIASLAPNAQITVFPSAPAGRRASRP